MMFDDAFGVAGQCAETFRDGVRDAFGASIIADVLDPIRNEIGLLRSFHEEFQRHSSSVEQVLQEARSLLLDEGFRR
jgi:hypothetical protein